MRARLAFRSLLVALFSGGIALSGCSGGGTTALPECEDGRDNDDDGLIDEVDPACIEGADRESQDPTPACADGVDNDGDGNTDHPNDPGCTGPTDDDEFDPGEPDCSDGADNDGDGKTDYPNDPGCANANQDSEADTCATGACPACGDGDDNDGDGQTDFPNDTGCNSANDNDEFVLNPGACGPGLNVGLLPTTFPVTGTIGGGISRLLSADCGGRAAEVAYAVVVDRPVVMVASTDNAATTVNTVLYLRTNCTDAATELECADDVSATNNRSTLTVALTPGAYFLVVDGRDLASTGMFSLDVDFYAGQGETCGGDITCAPGYECRMLAGAAGTTCELPVCSDGRDDDGDTKIDYPNDPGCTSPTDGDETDTCPGTGCPQCGDGMDNDGDGFIDFPMDPECPAASGTAEQACSAETDPLITIVGRVTTGTTVGASNSLRPTCGSTTTFTAPERVHLLNLRVPVATLAINLTSSFDAATSILDATCGSTVVCSDPNTINRTNVAPGVYNIAVDGWSSGSGTYTLNVSGTIADGGACNDPLVAAGVLTCSTGFACTGTAGAETCQPAACNDTTDADGDGFPGFPTDPGCTSISDGDEADDCPSGPNCPQCSDDVDNDGDSTIDYPMDTGCRSASGDNEETCLTETDPLIDVTGPNISGTTVGATNDVRPTCGSSSHTAPERIHYLRTSIPLATLDVVLTSSFDAALSITDMTCGASAACADTPESLSRTNLAPGTYGLVVDGWGTGNGTYTMTVRGTIAAGNSCVDPLVTAGVFTCASGFTCAGTAGAETCVPAACNDAMDADGDGFNGYPQDPGCTSPSDNDEADTCPSGPGCPQCSDDLDNDSDGQIDFPMDVACLAASSNTEAACAAEVDPVPLITGPATSGTTVGASNSLRPTCGSTSHAAPERAHLLNLRVPVASLAVSLTSSFDAATSMTDVTCGTTIQCADPNSFTRTNVAAGSYVFVVDGWGTGSGTYTLNLSGTLPDGGSCADPLVAAGVLRCPAGNICAGPAGMETCRLAACNDMVDADGDGANGFPTDPGCTNADDNDEADDCPSGPMCPLCSNDLDDDSDGQIDYPLDTSCVFAGDNTEFGCGPEADDVIVLTGPTASGTTVGSADNFTPTCQSLDSGDRTYVINLAVPVASLTASTEGPGTLIDTVVSIMDATCGTSLGCDDDGGTTPSTASITTVTGLAAGSYGIVVDTFSTTTGAYQLTVSGTIAAGGSCADPLVAAGVLSCAAGTTCMSGTCQ
ncbi:MAG: hypothetical protein KBG48_36145 [Kofleriaceae bacterium]|jgi:hypothetical protein|nr:hypothetical protein [Kofleriaceae bacterium]MBP9172848.1 hypothetical protein [Kofleriaceae bacterium]MBP9863211.1 hypothetical protein [Kofleriaceae bacterium]